MTALSLCLSLTLRLGMSLCLCSGVLTCFSPDYAYAYITYACAYALVKTSIVHVYLIVMQIIKENKKKKRYGWGERTLLAGIENRVKIQPK